MTTRQSALGTQYSVKLPAFEGPLDLLLQLVERHSLPITEVSLAQVTDGYLRRVEQLEVQPEEMSYFLVVASRLLLLKSRHLLPRPPVETTDPSAEELAEQLRTYQRFKLAAARLRELEGSTCYTQIAPPPPPEPSNAVVSLPIAALERALRRSLARLDGQLPEGPPVPGLRLRLSDVVALAERLLRRDGRVSLGQLAGPGAGRAETVVAFLAALDLVRRRRARAVQEGLFAPVVLLPTVEGPD
ncbi:MAG: segregation/condensation protein A [Chloroflexota bacterium]|nr:segregation/condensation protein A [Chloroflexota bacterium]